MSDETSGGGGDASDMSMDSEAGSESGDLTFESKVETSGSSFDLEFETRGEKECISDADWQSSTGASWYDDRGPANESGEAQQASVAGEVTYGGETHPAADGPCVNCGRPTFCCNGHLEVANWSCRNRCSSCGRGVDEPPYTTGVCGVRRCIGCGKRTSSTLCACFCQRLDPPWLAALPSITPGWAGGLPLVTDVLGVPGTIVYDEASKPIGRISPFSLSSPPPPELSYPPTESRDEE